MSWLAWLIVAFLALGPILSIATIGKPRQPNTPAGAVISVVLTALLIWGVVALATGAS